MGVHHIAIATKDLEVTHEFYTKAMGFKLVKCDVIRREGGWIKHAFYSTGSADDQLMAFFDLHDPEIGDDWSADISRGLGLPRAINHLAFSARGLDDIERKRNRWLSQGYDVLEIDHGWCTSIYTDDPSGIMVEFCTLTGELDPEEADRALEILRDPQPQETPGAKKQTFYKAADYRPE